MESARPVIVVTGKRRPHEVFLLGFSLVAGTLLMAGVTTVPPSLLDLGGLWLGLWMASLALSGAVGLVGSYWRRNLWMGLALERAGLLLNAACVFTYAVMVYSENGSSGLFAAGFFLAWTVSNVVRSFQISNDLRSLGRGIRDARGPVG